MTELSVLFEMFAIINRIYIYSIKGATRDVCLKLEIFKSRNAMNGQLIVKISQWIL